jgi:hypothetical protein
MPPAAAGSDVPIPRTHGPANRHEQPAALVGCTRQSASSARRAVSGAMRASLCTIMPVVVWSSRARERHIGA